MSGDRATGSSTRDIVVKAVAESLWGEGCYPFNGATGFTVRFQSEMTADAVLVALKEAGFDV